MLRRAAQKAWRGATQPRRTYHEAEVLGDLVKFRLNSSRALRKARPRRADAGTALVVSLSDFLYQIKLEGVLAKALQLEGYRPVILTVRHARWARAYFSAYGIEDLVYPEDFLEPARKAEADRAAAEFLAGEVTVQSLKALEYHGAHVGQQTLSSLSRGMQQGRVSLDHPEVRAALPRLLADAMESVLAAEALLDQVEPEILLFNEKGYAGFGSIYNVALGRGANVIQFLHAGIHWPDALLLKRYTADTERLHPASLSDESWELVRSMPWTERHERELDEEFALRYGSGVKHPDAGLQEGKKMKRREEILAQLGLDPARKTAVIFSHVLWDANLFYGRDLFDDQETWLVESVKAACESPAVNWIVKLHPANLYKAETAVLNDEAAIREAVGELPPHVKLLRPETDVNTFSIFQLADWGVTIRGTVGLELPCFGAPMLTAGTGRYSGMGFTNDSETAGEYLGKLRRIDEIPPLSPHETELARRHAYGLFRLRPFRFESCEGTFMPASRLRHPLSHNLRLKLRTREEVERANDLRAFAAWALDRSKLDYLNAH